VAGRPLGCEFPQEDLLVRARHEGAVHRTVRQKPISADTLRVKLGIGSATARRLVKIVRAEFQESRLSGQGELAHLSRTDVVNAA
jgi:hypothetical protein